MSQFIVCMFFLAAFLSIGVSVAKADGKMRSEVKVSVNEHGDLVQEADHKAIPASAKPERKAMEINGEGKVVALVEEMPASTEKTRSPVEVSGNQADGAKAGAPADQSSLMRSKRTESKISLEHGKEDDDPALDELEAMAIRTKLHEKDEHDSAQGSDGHRRRRWWGSKEIPEKPKVDCRWTPWGDKGDCSKTCGGGKQKQKRRKSPEAAHGGKKCEGDDERNTKKCNEDDCPTTTTTTPVTMTMSTMAGTVSANGVLWLALLLPTAFTLVA